MSKIIPVKGLVVTVLSTGLNDVIRYVLYCPFSKSNFILLEDSLTEYQWPLGIKPLK